MEGTDLPFRRRAIFSLVESRHHNLVIDLSFSVFELKIKASEVLVTSEAFKYMLTYSLLYLKGSSEIFLNTYLFRMVKSVESTSPSSFTSAALRFTPDGFFFNRILFNSVKSEESMKPSSFISPKVNETFVGLGVGDSIGFVGVGVGFVVVGFVEGMDMP